MGFMGYREEEFVLNNMADIINAKMTADVCSQLFFQLEKMFFLTFNRDMPTTLNYAHQCLDKSVNYDMLPNLLSKIKANNRTRGPSKYLDIITDAVQDLDMYIMKFSDYSYLNEDPQKVYAGISDAETQAFAVSVLLRTLICRTFPALNECENKPAGTSPPDTKEKENQQSNNNAEP